MLFFLFNWECCKVIERQIYFAFCYMHIYECYKLNKVYFYYNVYMSAWLLFISFRFTQNSKNWKVLPDGASIGLRLKSHKKKNVPSKYVVQDTHTDTKMWYFSNCYISDLMNQDSHTQDDKRLEINTWVQLQTQSAHESDLYGHGWPAPALLNW